MENKDDTACQLVAYYFKLLCIMSSKMLMRIYYCWLISYATTHYIKHDQVQHTRAYLVIHDQQI